jgi:hypothetical protein
MRTAPCLRFAKMLGSGFEGGFGLRPSRSRQAVFAVFSNMAAAKEFVEYSELSSTYRQRSNEFCAIVLRAWSCRGSWDGSELIPSLRAPRSGALGPIAALTRASIQLHKAPAFWRYAPAAQTALDASKGCQLAVGLGEAPFLRQATFSVWDDLASMDAYARSGAHLAGIRAAQAQQFFSESMFVRFIPLSMQGTWWKRQMHRVEKCAK